MESNLTFMPAWRKIRFNCFLGFGLAISMSLMGQKSSAMELKDIVPGQVELLISAPSTISFESMFGHAALLIVPEGQQWTNGYVIDFVANFSGSKLSVSDYYLKGLTGGVPIALQSQFAQSYFYKRLAEEGRDVERLVLPMTSIQKKRLWAEIVFLQEHPEKMGSYMFHLRNCASMLLEVLKRSGVSINFDQIYERSKSTGISPMQLISQLRTSLVTPYPSVKALSIATKANDVKRKYSLDIRSIPSKEKGTYAEWSPSEISKLEQMSLEELILAAQLISTLDAPRSQVLKILIRKTGRRIHTGFLDLKGWPRSFYNVCEDDGCFKRLGDDMTAFYGQQALSKLWTLNRQESQRTDQLHVPELDLEGGIHPLFWKGLTNSLSNRILGSQRKSSR